MDVWYVCAFFCVCFVLCLGRGLATSWSLVQGVLPSANDQETEKLLQSGKKREKKYCVQIFSWARICCICSWTAQTQGLLGLIPLFIYNAVQSVQTQPTFRRNTSPPSSGSKNKTSSACYLLYAGFLLGLSFSSENSGDCSSEKSIDFQRTTRRYISELFNKKGTYILLIPWSHLSLYVVS
jgi:hypothetical protein